MRRVGIAVVAAGYALSFLAVCLGACLAPDTSSSHACCPQGEGMRAATQDCCSVVPAVSHASAPVVGVAGRGPVPPVPARVEMPSGPLALPVAVAASPPLVLRI
jgi:hypothetical protein